MRHIGFPLILLALLLVLPTTAFAGLADDLRESKDLVLAFGGRWAELKAAEMQAAWNIYDRVKADTETSWFSIGSKWNKVQELWKAKDELKAARERVEAYEREVNFGKVRDTGKELFDRAMIAVGLVGHFNKDVKAFHRMVTASERLVEAAHEYRKANWWQFMEKNSRARSVLFEGKNVWKEWKDFRNTGGGKLIRRVVDFARKWGGLLGGGWLGGASSGRILPELPSPERTNPASGRVVDTRATSDRLSADEEAQTVGLLRQQAYRRMSDALARDAGADELQRLKEEFDLLDAQYQRLKNR